MRTFIIAMLWLMLVSCTTLRSFERETEKTRSDTIVRIDTITRVVKLPGETKMVYRDRIDTVCISRIVEQIRHGTFTTDTLFADTKYAHAWAGVYRNVPFIGIRQDEIELIFQEYERRITILQQTLKEREKEVVKRYAFYENPWFWMFASAGIAWLVSTLRKRI